MDGKKRRKPGAAGASEYMLKLLLLICHRAISPTAILQLDIPADCKDNVKASLRKTEW